MTTFQILTILLSFLMLLGAIVGVFFKTKLDVAKLQVKILELETRINLNANNIESGRKENREDHRAMFVKMDLFLAKIN